MAKKEAKEEAPKYAAPPVEMGDIVLWHPNPGEPAVCAAVVTEVHGETLSCSLLMRNFYNMEPKDGVRHVGYPDHALVLATESGCWSHKPGFLSAAEALAEIERLVMGSTAEG